MLHNAGILHDCVLISKVKVMDYVVKVSKILHSAC